MTDVFVEQVVGPETVLQADKILRIFLIRDEQQTGVELAVGFEAVGTIKRSQFGVSPYIPAVSDAVRLHIAEALRHV